MREELPFTIVRDAKNEDEVLALVANLMLARELFRVIAKVNFPEEIYLREGARIVEASQPGHRGQAG